MSRLRMKSCLLLAASMAACNDRNTPTAPAARPLAATATLALDRPYTWSFTCKSSKAPPEGIDAKWHWNENGVAIAGTELSAGCYPNNTVSGPGVRPANANGFWACISAWPTWGSMPQPSCQTWTFDPSQSFTAQLKGMMSLRACYPPSNRCETVKVSGTLQISS